MPTPDLQDMFTRAVLGVIKQGRPAIADEGVTRCVYRTTDGLKCAVGQLIPDDKYKPEMDNEMESTGVNSFERIDVRRAIGVRKDSKAANMLVSLQNAHDSSLEGPGFVEDFKRRAKSVADEYKLQMPDDALPV